MESEEAAHEAWVASLIPPPEAPVTAHEEERAAMINRRRHFMATLMDQPLTEETFAAARAANISRMFFGNRLEKYQKLGQGPPSLI